MTTPISALPKEQKLAIVIMRADAYMPTELQAQFKAMVSPQSLAIMTGTLVAWAASHFFGVGEVVDILLLGVGFVSLGFSIFKLADEFTDFVKGSLNATNDAELNEAAKHLAKAVILGNLTIINLLLMRGSVKQVIARGKPAWNPGLKQANGKPWAGARPNDLALKRTNNLEAGKGWTDWYGKIRLSAKGTLEQQQLAYYHELMHSYLRPRLGPLSDLRAGFASSANNRSKILKYIEEMICETYALMKVRGASMENVKAGINFPVAQRYVTVSRLAVEGQAVGAIVLNSEIYTVYVLNTPQDTPACFKEDASELVCRTDNQTAA